MKYLGICFWHQVSDQKKQVGSTEGMQTTVMTSELMQHRIKMVPKHTQDIIKAIQDRDFPTFAKITMQVRATHDSLDLNNNKKQQLQCHPKHTFSHTSMHKEWRQNTIKNQQSGLPALISWPVRPAPWHGGWGWIPPQDQSL